MLASFIKFFPFLWPFIKETLLGGRNHPLFQHRRRSKWVKVIIVLLITAVVSLGDAYLSLAKENEVLKKQISDQKTRLFTESSAKLLFCEEKLGGLKSQVITLQRDVAFGKLSCSETGSQLGDIIVPPTHRIPPTIKETIGQKAQRKLDAIED